MTEETKTKELQNELKQVEDKLQDELYNHRLAVEKIAAKAIKFINNMRVP